jgi:hypothetical protein
MTRHVLSRVEQAIYEIEHCGAGYSCRRNGTVLEITHADFAKPLQISVGRLKPSTVVAALEGYREAITGGAS